MSTGRCNRRNFRLQGDRPQSATVVKVVEAASLLVAVVSQAVGVAVLLVEAVAEAVAEAAIQLVEAVAEAAILPAEVVLAVAEAAILLAEVVVAVCLLFPAAVALEVVVAAILPVGVGVAVAVAVVAIPLVEAAVLPAGVAVAVAEVAIRLVPAEKMVLALRVFETANRPAAVLTVRMVQTVLRVRCYLGVATRPVEVHSAAEAAILLNLSPVAEVVAVLMVGQAASHLVVEADLQEEEPQAAKNLAEVVAAAVRSEVRRWPVFSLNNRCRKPYCHKEAPRAASCTRCNAHRRRDQQGNRS